MKTLVHGNGNQIFLDAPGEHPFDPTDELVDALPSHAFSDDLAFPGHFTCSFINDLHLSSDLVDDHGLADSLEVLWSEGPCRPPAVVSTNETQCQLDRGHFARRLSVLDVVTLRKPPVTRNQLDDRQRRVGRDGWGWLTASSKELGNQPVVVFPAFWGIVFAKVMVTAIDRDDRTLAGLVKTVGRVLLVRHLGAGVRAKSSTVLDFFGFQTAPPTIGGLA